MQCPETQDLAQGGTLAGLHEYPVGNGARQVPTTQYKPDVQGGDPKGAGEPMALQGELSAAGPRQVPEMQYKPLLQ